MLFEFPSEVLVKKVKVNLGGYAPSLPSAQTEIRLGSSMPNGPTDFSQLELIGTYNNASKNGHRTYSVSPANKAKFLAILETDGTDLEIIFIEVI